MGSPLGAYKTSAQKINMSLEEYLNRKFARLKRCASCKRWVELTDFHNRSARCKPCDRLHHRECRRRKKSQV